MTDSQAYSITQPKIGPASGRTPATKPDGSPNDNDRTEIGPSALAFAEWQALGIDAPNLDKIRRYRRQRVLDQLQARDYAGVLLFDPLNIRYLTDSSNMQVWVSHNPARAAFISADGYMVQWDFHNCAFLSSHLPLINEHREGAGLFYMVAGDQEHNRARRLAAEIDDLLRRHGGDNRRLAVDRMELSGAAALQALGIEIQSGGQVMEHARLVKSADEIRAMRCAMASCNAAIDEMHPQLRPGISEVELWSYLHAGNIKRGGEWIETRILSSGPRTNPWMREAGPRIIQEGDLVGFDTDMIGAYGICIDISRTWYCGDGRPSDEQRRLHAIALEHISRNAELLKPGVALPELTENAHRLPEDCRPQRYGVLMHGAGLCDEFPCIYYPEDFIPGAYDYVLEPGMVLCVEAYVGKVGGSDGVKLENQVVITEDGYENLTHYPYDERLTAG